MFWAVIYPSDVYFPKMYSPCPARLVKFLANVYPGGTAHDIWWRNKKIIKSFMIKLSFIAFVSVIIIKKVKRNRLFKCWNLFKSSNTLKQDEWTLSFKFLMNKIFLICNWGEGPQNLIKKFEKHHQNFFMQYFFSYFSWRIIPNQSIFCTKIIKITNT